MPIRESYAEGTPCWVDLSTTDIEGSKAFYSTLFGWEWEQHERIDPISDEFHIDDGYYHVASLQGHTAAGLMLQHQEQVKMGLPPVWNVHMAVDDIEATMRKVEVNGGSVMVPAFDVKNIHRMAVATDPTGAVICFWQAGEGIGAEIVGEPGSFNWVDLVTLDQATAAEFFVKVVGMNQECHEMPGLGNVHFLRVGEESVAAIAPPPMEGVSPHWETYFAVADCDASCAMVTELGGSIVLNPFDIPPGRMAVATDPAGATFAIIKPAKSSPL